MPDLDQLLDTLIADVAAGTRPPGAPQAIKKAVRRRAMVAVAAGFAVACIAVGGVVAVGSVGGGDRPAPSGGPTTPVTSASDPSTPRTPAGSHAALYELGQELDALLTTVPGWTVTGGFPEGYDYAFNGRCSGSWTSDATSGSDGGAPGDPGLAVGIGTAGFPSAARAADAVDAFVHDLETCTATAWRARPIGQTGALLASSKTAVTWIQRTGAVVRVLQVTTPDGPPPEGVQIAVADWLVAYNTWQQEHRRAEP